MVLTKHALDTILSRLIKKGFSMKASTMLYYAGFIILSFTISNPVAFVIMSILLTITAGLQFLIYTVIVCVPDSRKKMKEKLKEKSWFLMLFSFIVGIGCSWVMGATSLILGSMLLALELSAVFQILLIMETE